MFKCLAVWPLIHLEQARVQPVHPTGNRAVTKTVGRCGRVCRALHTNTGRGRWMCHQCHQRGQELGHCSTAPPRQRGRLTAYAEIVWTLTRDQHLRHLHYLQHKEGKERERHILTPPNPIIRPQKHMVVCRSLMMQGARPAISQTTSLTTETLRMMEQLTPQSPKSREIKWARMARTAIVHVQPNQT